MFLAGLASISAFISVLVSNSRTTLKVGLRLIVGFVIESPVGPLTRPLARPFVGILVLIAL